MRHCLLAHYTTRSECPGVHPTHACTPPSPSEPPHPAGHTPTLAAPVQPSGGEPAVGRRGGGGARCGRHGRAHALQVELSRGWSEVGWPSRMGLGHGDSCCYHSLASPCASTVPFPIDAARSNGYHAGSTAVKHFWQVVREMGQVRAVRWPAAAVPFSPSCTAIFTALPLLCCALRCPSATAPAGRAACAAQVCDKLQQGPAWRLPPLAAAAHHSQGMGGRGEERGLHFVAVLLGCLAAVCCLAGR